MATTNAWTTPWSEADSCYERDVTPEADSPADIVDRYVPLPTYHLVAFTDKWLRVSVAKLCIKTRANDKFRVLSEVVLAGDRSGCKCDFPKSPIPEVRAMLASDHIRALREQRSSCRGLV